MGTALEEGKTPEGTPTLDGATPEEEGTTGTPLDSPRTPEAEELAAPTEEGPYDEMAPEG